MKFMKQSTAYFQLYYHLNMIFDYRALSLQNQTKANSNVFKNVKNQGIKYFFFN